jgi:hypothetical protein
MDPLQQPLNVGQDIEQRLHKFINQKSISQNFLNIAILQNQIGILISTLQKSDYTGSDKALISLILLNITFQGIIFFCITLIDYINPSNPKSKGINVLVTFISGIVLIINVTITILTG